MARQERIRYLNVDKSVESKLATLKRSDMPGPHVHIIERFIDEMAMAGLSKHRQSFYLSTLRKIATQLGDAFPEPTRADIEVFVRWVEGEAYSDWTRINYRTTLKRFYKWHLGKDEEYPECVRWVKTRKSSNNGKLPEDLLTPGEVKSLISACMNQRDKAIIGALYDSGCRIGELLQMRIRDFRTDEYGAVFMVDGKTGSRRVRVVGDSIPLVCAWLEVHPGRTNPQSPLWINLQYKDKGEPLQYPAVRKLLTTAGQRAGIKKRIHAHLFRHTRATEMAQNISEAPLENQMGWVHGSGMTRQYVHLSGKDVDRAVLKGAGIDYPDDDNNSTVRHQPRVCTRCECINLHDSQFCRRCGLPQTMDAMKEVDEAKEYAIGGDATDLRAMTDLLTDPKVAKFMQLMKENIVD